MSDIQRCELTNFATRAVVLLLFARSVHFAAATMNRSCIHDIKLTGLVVLNMIAITWPVRVLSSSSVAIGLIVSSLLSMSALTCFSSPFFIINLYSDGVADSLQLVSNA